MKTRPPPKANLQLNMEHNKLTKQENTIMANANINTGIVNEAQFTVDYQKSGYGAVIPVIDGVPHKELMMGYVSEEDAAAGMKLLEEALKATGGDIPKAMQYMYTAATVAANDIKAEEAVEINGVDFIIDYKAKKIWQGEYEIANLDNITAALSNEAVKELLIDKVRTALNDPYWDDED